MLFRFGNFELDRVRGELRCEGRPQAVEPQVFSILSYLIRHRDRLVSKEELVEAIWQGRIVTDATISSRINAVRRAVGDSGKLQCVVRTFPKRGFRFVAEAKTAEVEADPYARTSGGSQAIRYCSTDDGVQLACSKTGRGPPVVKTANWLNHLEYDWQSPVFAPLFHQLTSMSTLLRYDSRGVGLSDWQVDDLSFEAMATDLETVVAAAGLDRFALFGISQGAALAIDYAARHPERVSHMVLWGGFSRGRNRRGSRAEEEQAKALQTLMRQGWGRQSSAFRQMFAALYLPDASEEQIRWWTDLQRVATSPENAVRLRSVIDDLDVSAQLPCVRAPTLILHSERDSVAPLAEARLMSARIPDAFFVPLDSANHLVMEQEPAWTRAVAEIRNFLPGDVD